MSVALPLVATVRAKVKVVILQDGAIPFPSAEQPPPLSQAIFSSEIRQCFSSCWARTSGHLHRLNPPLHAALQMSQVQHEIEAWYWVLKYKREWDKALKEGSHSFLGNVLSGA